MKINLLLCSINYDFYRTIKDEKDETIDFVIRKKEKRDIGNRVCSNIKTPLKLNESNKDWLITEIKSVDEFVPQRGEETSFVRSFPVY